MDCGANSAAKPVAASSSHAFGPATVTLPHREVTGVTNTFVLIILIIALAGETYFREIESLWGRGLSQLVALLFAPGRVFWLAARLIEVAFGRGLGWTGGLIGGCLLAVPAIVLALVFVWGGGGAMLHSKSQWLMSEIGRAHV